MSHLTDTPGHLLGTAGPVAAQTLDDGVHGFVCLRTDMMPALNAAIAVRRRPCPPPPRQ